MITLAEQQELFLKDCKPIDLFFEYPGYTGTEKWAIVTAASKEELWMKYPDVINGYTPFILLSIAQGEVIDESYRNNHKHEMRESRNFRACCFMEEFTKPFYREHFTLSLDPYEILELMEKERQRQMEIGKVRRIIGKLTLKQRERLLKYFLKDKSSNQIAREEGTYHSTVLKSIRAAIKNFRKYYAEL